MRDVTVVMTSCGRPRLLEETLSSFLEQNTHPISRCIIIDNSADTRTHEHIQGIIKDLDECVLIPNRENIGQVSSIDTAYSLVDTPYIFHLEDDWYFTPSNGDFIDKSIDLLQYDCKIINVNLRERFGREASSHHPISDLKFTSSGTSYHEYIPGYKGVWHGFAWNPGLRRTADYQLIAPYKQYTNEQGVGQKYYELGFRAACLQDSYCRHIGEGQQTIKRNE